MKLLGLGWMHRKLCHNSNEPFKDVIIAHSAFDGRDCHTSAYFGSKYGSGGLKQPNQELENNTTTLKPELFAGFLAIGTFGSEPILSGPATPTFPMSSEDVAEVTENDIKLINNEIDKFLDGEANGEGHNEVSSGRCSYVSIVALNGGKPLEGAKDEQLIYPLQDYLFGSSVENSETKVKASLGELFQRTKLEDDPPEKCMNGHHMEVKQPHKSAKHLIKKFLKKLCASSRDSALSSNADSGSKKKKLRKMFHKKIHPGSPIAEKELHKVNHENTKSFIDDDAYGDIHLDSDKRLFPHGFMPVRGARCYEAIKVHNYEHADHYHSSGNMELWIKTDADYLVLELDRRY
ncbi:hypothetical protein ACFE04_009662 [Oxalis oulophora]